MKIGLNPSLLALAAMAVPMVWTARASAQEATTTTTVQSTPQPAAPPAATTTTTSAPIVVDSGQATTSRAERTSGYAPNTVLLATGAVIFGGTYVTSVIIGASSGNDADHHLYVPIAGPWIDMANRNGCPVGATSCDSETTNKVLLGVDGVFQAIGALEIIGAFLYPEKREVATTVQATAYTPAITILPEKVGGTGYGLGAFAQF